MEKYVNRILGLRDGRLASSFYDNTIKITTDTQFKNYSTLKGHLNKIVALAQLDDTILASGSYDKTVRLWNLTSMTSIANFTNHTGYVSALIALNLNDQSYLISGSNDNTTKIWNSTGLEMTVPSNTSSQVKAIAYTKYSNTLAIGFSDSAVHLYELISLYVKCIANLTGNNNNDIVYALTVLPSSQNIVSASGNLKIKIWNSSAPNNVIANLTNHTSPVLALTFLPSTEYIVSGSDSIKIWNSTSYKFIQTLPGNNSQIRALAVLLSTETIVSASLDTTVKL